MKTLFKKIFLGTVAAVFFMMPVLSFVMPASAEVDLWGEGNKEAIRQELGYDSTTADDPRIVAASIIRILLTFLGIVAVVLIIWGGFTWMTAGGNDEKVEKARKIIVSAVIGLIIILAAWVIAGWVIDTVNEEVLNSGA